VINLAHELVLFELNFSNWEKKVEGVVTEWEGEGETMVAIGQIPSFTPVIGHTERIYLSTKKEGGHSVTGKGGNWEIEANWEGGRS